MRMILGLDKPSSGTALFNGQPFTSFSEPLREVGALLDPGAVHPGRTGRNGTVALSDRKRTTPQILGPGDGLRTHCANTTPFSVGWDGRVSARCDSQPEDLLHRDDVDT